MDVVYKQVYDDKKGEIKMSKDNVELFLHKVNEDVKLQEKIKHLYAENQENMQASLIKLGADAGYHFSKEDLERFNQEMVPNKKQNGELDEAQLEAVAGGNNDEHWIILSILSVGILCALSGIGRAVSGCTLDE